MMVRRKGSKNKKKKIIKKIVKKGGKKVMKKEKKPAVEIDENVQKADIVEEIAIPAQTVNEE